MRSLLVATAITSLLTLAAASKCLEKATWSHFVDATITVHGMPESDRIQRNHLIVYYYHEMGRCFDELLDTDREANWLVSYTYISTNNVRFTVHGLHTQ
jgi:hypothetical protein